VGRGDCRCWPNGNGGGGPIKKSPANWAAIRMARARSWSLRSLSLSLFSSLFALPHFPQPPFLAATAAEPYGTSSTFLGFLSWRRRLGERRRPSARLRRQRAPTRYARPFTSLRAGRNGAPQTLLSRALGLSQSHMPPPPPPPPASLSPAGRCHPLPRGQVRPRGRLVQRRS